MARTFEFFFDYTSPYSYLASTQVERIAARTGAELAWRPFLLGAVFKATGNTPPSHNPYKAQYLLKDLMDWVAHYGLPDLVFPEAFPANSLLADRLGLVAAEAGRIAEFSRALFSRIFVRGQDPADVSVLREAIAQCGMAGDEALERAASPAIKDALRKNTDEAVQRGSFGAPTFFVGDQMFLGNDRLMFVEKALAKASTEGAP